MTKQFYFRIFDTTNGQKNLIDEIKTESLVNDSSLPNINNAFDFFTGKHKHSIFYFLGTSPHDSEIFSKFTIESNLPLEKPENWGMDYSLLLFFQKLLSNNLKFLKYFYVKKENILSKFICILNEFVNISLDHNHPFEEKLNEFMRENFETNEKLKEEAFNLNIAFYQLNNADFSQSENLFDEIEHFLKGYQLVHLLYQFSFMKEKTNFSTNVLDNLLSNFLETLEEEQDYSDIIQDFISKRILEFESKGIKDRYIFDKILNSREAFPKLSEIKNLQAFFIETLDKFSYDLEDDNEIVQLILKTDIKSVLEKHLKKEEFKKMKVNVQMIYILLDIIKGGKNV